MLLESLTLNGMIWAEVTELKLNNLKQHRSNKINKRKPLPKKELPSQKVRDLLLRNQRMSETNQISRNSAMNKLKKSPNNKPRLVMEDLLEESVQHQLKRRHIINLKVCKNQRKRKENNTVREDLLDKKDKTDQKNRNPKNNPRKTLSQSRNLSSILVD